MLPKLESNLQQEIFIYYNNSFCLKHHENRAIIFSIPNGGTRNIREAVALKKTGLLAGASDLIVITPKGKLMFVELKINKGKQSDAQIDFQQRVENLGFEYHIVKSLEEFKKII
jgi:hypothetical protein